MLIGELQKVIAEHHDAEHVPVEEIFEKKYHNGNDQLTKLSHMLTFITGARAPHGDSIGESAGDDGASGVGTDEMIVSGLIEQLQAAVAGQAEADDKAVCIITGLGKVTRELQLHYNYSKSTNQKIQTQTF